MNHIYLYQKQRKQFNIVKKTMTTKASSKHPGFLTIPKLDSLEYQTGVESEIAKANYARFAKYALKRAFIEPKSFIENKSKNRHNSVKKYECSKEPSRQLASIILGRAPETENSLDAEKRGQDIASFCSNTISLLPAVDPQRTKTKIYSLDYSKRIEKSGHSVRKVIMPLKGRDRKANKMQQLKVKAIKLKEKDQESQKKTKSFNLKNTMANRIKLRKFSSNEKKTGEQKRNYSPYFRRGTEMKPWQLLNQYYQSEEF